MRHPCRRPGSPYACEARQDPGRHTRCFHIQVTRKAAFRSLRRGLSRDHPWEAIRFWLRLDDLVFVPWLVKFLWGRLKGRKLHPT